jgi:hypothetical protein
MATQVLATLVLLHTVSAPGCHTSLGLASLLWCLSVQIPKSESQKGFHIDHCPQIAMRLHSFSTWSTRSTRQVQLRALRLLSASCSHSFVLRWNLFRGWRATFTSPKASPRGTHSLSSTQQQCSVPSHCSQSLCAEPIVRFLTIFLCHSFVLRLCQTFMKTAYCVCRLPDHFRCLVLEPPNYSIRQTPAKLHCALSQARKSVQALLQTNLSSKTHSKRYESRCSEPLPLSMSL